MQTLAIFKDAYRELNSKKLFWVVLGLSVAVVAAIALPSNNEKGIGIFGASAEFPLLSTRSVSAKGFYSFLFSWFGINLWLTWGATILALISTAGMIPDMVTGGAVDLVLSKPISRLRLFLTKFTAGLLFVALQATVFALGAVLVIGLRSGSWEWRPLLAVPLVVVFFSYLFSVCVLVGLVTRSTLIALLATVLLWLGIWALGTVETFMLDQRLAAQREVTRIEGQIDQFKNAVTMLDEQIRRMEAGTTEDEGTDTAPSPPAAPASDGSSPGAGAASQSATSATAPAGAGEERRGRRQNRSPVGRLLAAGQQMLNAASTGDVEAIKKRRATLQAQVDQLERELPESRTSMEGRTRWHRRLYAAAAVLPKTGETKRLFQRFVVDKEDQEGFLKILAELANDPGGGDLEEELNRRPLWWVLGTSLAFEVAVLGLACWIFVRRDF